MADAQRRPINNFMAATESDSIFLNSVNTERKVKNRQYIVVTLKDCIREIVAQNVIQIITDNASACKDVGTIVESKYPHIFWTPCVVYILNLTLKNICAAKKLRQML